MGASSRPREGLVHVSDDEPGIVRRRAGRGFTYVDHRGRRVTKESSRARIRALAIPPAWTDVWICANPRGHLQATGRDAKGRKQYRYHPRFRAQRDADKYAHLLEFGLVLPRIRKQVARDLALPGVPKERVLATSVRLLETTLMRVGNEEYARENSSYGLTTLRSKHAHVDGRGLRFVFTGKSGQEHEITVADPRLVRIIRRLDDLPGQHLFQYLDGDGARRPVQSGDVNAYLRAVTGSDVTAKDFRTWMGTLLAAAGLAAVERPASDRATNRVVKATVEVVARQLGNTPTVCRACYVHPVVVDRFLDSSLADVWDAAPSRAANGLIAEERKLLAVLGHRSRRRALLAA
jgi:DNA topoisomerase-1